MKTSINRLSALLIASSLALASAHTLAQAPASTAAKAQAATKAPSANAKRRNANDKVMSRDELRACMKLKDSNVARTAEIEQRNEQNRKEKEALLAAPQAAPADRADIDAKLELVKQADALVRENGKAIEAWNARNAEFAEKSKEMRNAARRGQVLREEQFKLKAENEKLVADRAAKVVVYEKAVTDYNAQIGKRSNGNEEWNKKNAQLAADEDLLVAARDKWMAECSDRRFREDDEIAIRAGK